VTESNWAAAGGSVSLAHITGSVGRSKTGQRIACVRSYFAAKAQQFSAAGYPSDTGGPLPPSALGLRGERDLQESRLLTRASPYRTRGELRLLMKHYAKWQAAQQRAHRQAPHYSPFARDDNGRHPRKTRRVTNEIASK